MNCKFIYPLFLASLSFLLLAPSWASAHKVNVFAYVEKGEVYVEGYFPDGRPVANGIIVVLDSAGNKILSGNTDPNGAFSFPAPRAEDLTIVINASMGHKNTFSLKKSDF